jgi:hypothetical protein
MSPFFWGALPPRRHRPPSRRTAPAPHRQALPMTAQVTPSPPAVAASHCGAYSPVFGFRLTIQNTTNRHVSNAFDLIAVFISFPCRASAWVAPPNPGSKPPGLVVLHSSSLPSVAALLPSAARIFPDFVLLLPAAVCCCSAAAADAARPLCRATCASTAVAVSPLCSLVVTAILRIRMGTAFGPVRSSMVTTS